MSLHTAGELDDVGDDLRLARREAHLLAETVHLVLERGEKEVAGGVLLQKNVAVRKKVLFGFFEGAERHEVLHDVGVLLGELVVVEHGDRLRGGAGLGLFGGGGSGAGGLGGVGVCRMKVVHKIKSV